MKSKIKIEKCVLLKWIIHEKLLIRSNGNCYVNFVWKLKKGLKLVTDY